MKRLLLLSVFLSGCATYASELNRGQTAYENNKHEQALAILRGLENDQSHFNDQERARYAYLRGMTDQRIGYRADARHWLAIAKEIDEAHPKSLSPEWRKKCDQALAELNDAVWSAGMLALDKPVKKSSDEGEKKDTDAPKKKPINEE